MRDITDKIDLATGAQVYINKPLGWSSFAVVKKFRYLATQYLGQRIKVGHAGTLDPLATGVMILCTGRSTKLIESLQQGVKEYVAEICLGATTPSFDLETEIDASYPTEHITEETIRSVLPTFLGEIAQTPPAFSACKIEGKRAYDMARKGKEVALQSKPITIHELELLEVKLPIIKLRVLCGKGTYIRALARDLGLALGSGAHLTALRRTRVGDALEHNCLEIEELETWLAHNVALPTKA